MNKLHKGILQIAKCVADPAVEQEKRGESYCKFLLHQPKRPVKRQTNEK
ncbi:MAG: hypothetical protein PUF65_08950 [Lachnospiraceae bacterium]|nr:hypothetical protein [Lachnospiraceae bacterium]